MTVIVPESRTWYRFIGGAVAWTARPDGLLGQHEIRGGDMVLADPRFPRQLRGLEVVEFFWEATRCWVDRKLFDRLARRVEPRSVS